MVTYDQDIRGADGEGFRDLRIGISLSIAPENAFKTHLLMRTELVRWADFRQEVRTCTRALKTSAGFAPTPMNIGAFSPVKGKKASAKARTRTARVLRRVTSAAHPDTRQINAWQTTCAKRVEKRTSRRQVPVRASNESHCTRLAKASRTNASVSIAARLGTCRPVVRARRNSWRDGAVPVQGDVRSLTALSYDDDDLYGSSVPGCVAPGPSVCGVPEAAAPSVPHHVHGCGPWRADPSDEVGQTWRLVHLAAAVMHECPRRSGLRLEQGQTAVALQAAFSRVT